MASCGTSARPRCLRGGGARGSSHLSRDPPLRAAKPPQPGPCPGAGGTSVGRPARASPGHGSRRGTPLRSPASAPGRRSPPLRRAGAGGTRPAEALAAGRGSGQGRRGRSRPPILDGFSLCLSLPHSLRSFLPFPLSFPVLPSPASLPPRPPPPPPPRPAAPPLALASSPGHAAHRAHINGGIFRGGHRPQTHPPRPLQERHPLPR